MTTGTEQRLDHLKSLEAESIHILREAAAEAERPIMLPGAATQGQDRGRT